MGQPSAANRSISSLKVSLIAQVVTIVTGVLKTFIFTIFISPGNFGLIALSTSITGIIQLLKDFGYSTYIVQSKEIDNNELIAINTRVFILACIAFLLTCIVAQPIASFYKQPELLWIIPITGVQFIFNSFTIVPLSLLRRGMEFDKVAKVEVGSNVVSLLSGLILLFFIRNYWVLLYSGISYLIFQLIILARLKPWKFELKNPFKNKLSKHSTKFGTQVTIFNVLTFITTNLDNVIIGKLYGNAILGVYSKGFEFGVTNIEKVKRPVQNVYFSDIANKDNDKRTNFFFQYLLFMMTILLLIVGPIIIYSKDIITKLFGNQWSSLNSMLPPFFLTSFLWITMSFADQLMIVTSKMKPYLILGIAKNGVGSIAIIIASFWGPNAIAWSYFIYHAVLFIPFCYYSFAAVIEEKRLIWKMVFESLLVVVSCLLSIGIPWILMLTGYMTATPALLLFLVFGFLVYTFVWKMTGAEEPYLFIKHIFKRPVVKPVL